MAIKQRASEDLIDTVHKGGRVALAALVGLMALVLAACGTGAASTTATAGGSDRGTVVIGDLEFTPETLTVQAGETVTWIWKDGAIAHDVAGVDFRSQVISEGTFRHRFDAPGTYDYACTLHPDMIGTIEVTT